MHEVDAINARVAAQRRANAGPFGVAWHGIVGEYDFGRRLGIGARIVYAGNKGVTKGGSGMVAEMGRDVEARQAMDAGQQEAGQDHERADQTPVDQTPVDQTPAEKTRRMPRTKNPDSTGDKSNGAASGANVPKSPPRAVVIASPLAEQEAVSQRLMEAQKLADLGLAHQHLGRLDDAVVSLRDALQITAEVFGPDAERLAPLYDMLANVEQMRGFADEAGHYQKRATALRAPREERRAV